MTPGVVALLAAALGAPGALRPSSTGDITWSRELLEDGTELIVLPIRGAPLTSLRHVVRAGSAFDPPGRDGLAHLLEHVIATARTGPASLLEDVQAAGGEMNAFTSADGTTFLLDAPSKAFPDLAARLLSAITNPRLDARDVAREQEVVQAEDRGSRGAIGLAVNAIFRTPGSILGTDTTRAKITREELAEFFARRYVTPATTVILAGDITLDQAKALVNGAFHLPPALPGEQYAARPGTPILPLDEKIGAPVNAVVLGYQIDEADRSLCGSLAELLGARLLLSLHVNRPLVADVQVECDTLRGNLFLIAAAYSRALDGVDVPAEVEAGIRTALDQPMTPGEGAVLARRRSRQLDALRESPPALASAVAELATVPRGAERMRTEHLVPPVAEPRALQAFARRALDPARRVRIELSPLRH